MRELLLFIVYLYFDFKIKNSIQGFRGFDELHSGTLVWEWYAYAIPDSRIEFPTDLYSRPSLTFKVLQASSPI